MKGQFMMISSIVAGVILIATASSISEVRSQNIEPEFARQEMDLIKEEAGQINTSDGTERDYFREYVRSIGKYESTVEYWEGPECFNITLQNQLSKYKMSCVGNKTSQTVKEIILELDVLSDFENKGTYDKLSAETSDISENLTIGYRNGNPGGRLKGFWRMDRSNHDYSVQSKERSNLFWTEGSDPDLNVRKIESDLEFQDPSSTSVTVNASNSGMGAWNVNVDLYNYTAGSVSWNHNYITSSNGPIEAIVPADIDHDGDTDVVYGSAIEETVKYAENDGNGGGWAVTTVGNQDVESVSVGDVDGDQDLDIVGGGNDGKIYFFENVAGDGSSWDRHELGDISATVRSLALGDLTGDGRIDVASTGFNDEVRYWENDGTDSGWSFGFVGSDEGWTVAIANIDGDDEPDIISGGDDGKVEFWDNVNGDASTWDRTVIEDESSRVFSLAITDIDKDGDLDVFSGVDNSNHDINLYRNDNGAGTSWTKSNIDSRDDSVRTLQIADIDFDSDKDLLTGINNDGSDNPIEYHENDGTYSSWSGTAIGSQGDQGHYGLAIADFNDNGVLDIVSGEDEGPADLRLWETQGIETDFIGSSQVDFFGYSGGSKEAMVTWTPEKYTYNLMAEVNPSRNFTEVLETNDETAGSTNNRILQTVKGSGVVTDYSGEGNTGKSRNWEGEERAAQGTFSTNGFDFDDENDVVKVPDDSDISGMSELTISTWVKRTGSIGSNWAHIVSKSAETTGAGNADYGIIQRDSGEVVFRLNTGGSYSDTEAVGNGLTLDEWEHIVGVWDGSEMRIYQNGVQIDSISKSGTLNDAGGPLGLGRHANNTNERYFTGLMDETKIYDEALSPSEVKDLFFDGDSGDFRGSYDSNSRNIGSNQSLVNLSVKSNVPTGTSGEVIVSHSSGSSQTISLDSGGAERNYTLSFSDEGGSANAIINLDSSVPQTTPEIDRLRLWTSN